MKNLFSVNRTQNKDATEMDPTPYLSARVSEEVRQKLKNAFAMVEEETAPREPTEEERALRKKGNRYWLLCLICLVLAVALFAVGSRTGLYQTLPALHILDLSLLVVCLIFNFKARKATRRQSDSRLSLQLDFSEASKRLEEAAAEAARELGVPETALTVDVFPYHYKMKENVAVPVGRRGHYDNISVSVFLRGEALCLATAQELFCIPLTDVKGYREYDEDFEIDMWLKPEEFDSDKYKEYGLRKSGFLARKGHGYFGLKLGDDAFEVLIPCYDFPLVKGLLESSGVS